MWCGTGPVLNADQAVPCAVKRKNLEKIICKRDDMCEKFSQSCNELLCHLYLSARSVRIGKSDKMECVGPAIRAWESRNSCRFLLGWKFLTNGHL